MLVEAQLSGVSALQQRTKAPNLDKGSQYVAFPGHSVTQALPCYGGCLQHSPGEQGLCLLSHTLKSYKCGFFHTNSSTHVALTCLSIKSSLLAVATVQADYIPMVCKCRPYKVLCTKGFDDTAEYIGKYSLERRYSHSLFPFWEIREKRSCPRLQIPVKLKYEFWAFQSCAFSPSCLLFTVQCWLINSTFHP